MLHIIHSAAKHTKSTAKHAECTAKRTHLECSCALPTSPWTIGKGKTRTRHGSHHPQYSQARQAHQASQAQPSTAKHTHLECTCAPRAIVKGKIRTHHGSDHPQYSQARQAQPSARTWSARVPFRLHLERRQPERARLSALAAFLRSLRHATLRASGTPRTPASCRTLTTTTG